MIRPLTIIESPYAGNLEENLLYLRRCLRDSWERGELPFASHAFFPLFLSESTERKEGIEAGYEFWTLVPVQSGEYPTITFYLDLGWSPGMEAAWRRAKLLGRRCETRTLSPSTTFEHKGDLRNAPRR